MSVDVVTRGRARAGKLSLSTGKSLKIPVYMPVGTQGAVKGLCFEELSNEPLSVEILLGNTYHLRMRPGLEVLSKHGSLVEFANIPRHMSLLTDSGGFQMVSLGDLVEVSEDGVSFVDPTDGLKTTLTPEDSMDAQIIIGSDVIMALDDVVHSCESDAARVLQAQERTVRWLDRCLVRLSQKALKMNTKFNLFPILQGGVDMELRRRCCDEFVKRASHPQIGGFAIGGLAGGESKSDFWRVVAYCCERLPKDKPRYLMGVGYDVDLVVCVLLGVDMFDCVFPTRTARFGTALVPRGNVSIKRLSSVDPTLPIYPGCACDTCACDPVVRYPRRVLCALMRSDSTVAASLISHHNVFYTLNLVRRLRFAILNDTVQSFLSEFLSARFVDRAVPDWVSDALRHCGY